MTGIINEIDAYTTGTFAYLRTKAWGYCEISYKSAKDSKGTLIGSSGSQPIVMQIPTNPVNNGDRGKQVTLDDQYDFMTWIRWVEPANFEFNEEWSFGRREAEEGSLTLRIIVAHKAILGENLIFTFARGIPRQLNLTGYRYVHLNGRPRINPDHEGIYQNELGNTVYEKHRFTWNIYAIDCTFNFIECFESTP